MTINCKIYNDLDAVSATTAENVAPCETMFMEIRDNGQFTLGYSVPQWREEGLQRDNLKWSSKKELFYKQAIGGGCDHKGSNLFSLQNGRQFKQWKHFSFPTPPPSENDLTDTLQSWVKW